MTGAEESQSAIPQTDEDVILPEINVTSDEVSREAATTAVEIIVSQQDSGSINKTSLKATTDEATIVSPVPRKRGSRFSLYGFTS